LTTIPWKICGWPSGGGKHEPKDVLVGKESTGPWQVLRRLAFALKENDHGMDALRYMVSLKDRFDQDEPESSTSPGKVPGLFHQRTIRG
jgi:hypothetical protein